jgi:ATP-dependent helicase HrpA
MTDARITELRELLPQTMLQDWVRLGSRLVRLLRDAHHSVKHEAILDRLLQAARASAQLRADRLAYRPTINYPSDLPIIAKKDEIVQAIRTHQVVVVGGETGSGKTTQLPKMCLEAGLGIEAKIGCTQPRRIAALSISQRIAEELQVEWGRGVGCKIRFDDRSSPESYIKLMTDGMLLAETQGDHLLSEYNALIIDEAHERSLNIDFILGYLKGLLARRRDLKLIVTSATIDLEAFSRAFDDAPIIEVSGRLFPVGVLYSPLDEASEEEGEMTIIDAAVRCAGQMLCEPGDGDILIFMPGERDIRETADLLESRYGDDADVVPLFGRLATGDQQRVFSPSRKRKIVVATNIAETSLTIPNIRFVIDSGLARISRYNPRTRTKRLPIEPVAQSSANQRKGRSGRVREGLCVRLYSEEDFLARPPFTQPEIQRANLAEVILRMKAFSLGEIETFPFLNPPTPAAIQAGYRLLQELGALDEQLALTQLGKDLARLPIDPTLGRMLLQAQQEHAVRELLIIAAGLSIQDPRERPLDQKDAAAAAHKRFVDPQSDFLTLLNIWTAVHEQWETLRTQGQRRKFCKAHFLSYIRMREWQDLHAQLESALRDIATVRLNESNAAYEAIHRSILSGLLGHIAQRAERNLYKAPGNRQITIFPGSALYFRPVPTPKRRQGQKGPEPKPDAGGQPEWIVAGEIVETSQLFARTVAGVEPAWIVALAKHVCKTTHENPHWSAESGRVMVEERITLYGMEIFRRQVAYGNINPADATRIFIRSALVEEHLFPAPPPEVEEEADGRASRAMRRRHLMVEDRPSPVPPRFRFLEQNRAIREKIETWQTKARRHDLVDVDGALVRFYEEWVLNVSSLEELNRLLGANPDPSFLCASEEDLLGGQTLDFDAAAFPDSIQVEGKPVPLAYAYKPGEEQDGVTVRLGFNLAQTANGASLEWSVPGLREAQVSELLRALPKSFRRELMPLAPKVVEIVRDLRPSGSSLKQDLARFIRQHYHLEVTAASWAEDALPKHLQPRVEILDEQRKVVASGRDLDTLRRQLAQEEAKRPPAKSVWSEFAARWERPGLTSWSFGDVPERVEITEPDGSTVDAFPGLAAEEGHVSLRLFRTASSARAASLGGIHALLERELGKDLAWLQKDLRGLASLAPILAGFTTVEDLQTSAYEHLKRHLFPAEAFTPLTHLAFQTAAARAKVQLPGLAMQFIDRLGPLLKMRQEIARRYSVAVAKAVPRTLADLGQLQSGAAKPVTRQSAVIATELPALMPPSFLDQFPYDRLNDLQRYLKALSIRAERAALNPAKDQEKAKPLAPYLAALPRLRAQAKTPEARQAVLTLMRAVEEFKISLFAQELGTAFPISSARLDDLLRQVTTVVGR